jgi:hypothetical protein
VDDREQAERRKAEKQKADWEKLARWQEARDQERQEREHNLQEFRDRCFEVQKHVATLSTAAALLILAVYRERPFEEALLAVTLVLLAMSVVIAVHGMHVQARDTRDPRESFTMLSYDEHINWTTSGASNLLIGAVVALAFFLFHIPLWIALGVLGVWVVVWVVRYVVFLVITLIRY